MIGSAKNKRLGQTVDLPDVSAGVDSFLQNVNIGIVQKTQVDGLTQEIPIFKRSMACVQPMPEKLAILKEGERSWKWYDIYTLADVILNTDDIVVLFGTSYRIMDKENWNQHGYLKYSAIEYYKKFDA